MGEAVSQNPVTGTPPYVYGYPITMEPRVRMAYTMYQDQQLSVTEICATLQLSQATFYRYVALGKRAAEASGMS
jgi:hypothetical protein